MRGEEVVVPVELVDAAGRPGPTPDAGPPPGEDAGDRRRRRAVVLVVAGLGAVLLAAAVAVSVTQQREATARRAELDALGWVLPTLDEPLAEAWRGPSGWTVATTDEVLALADDEGQGTLRGVDAATGEVVWERAEGESCGAVSETPADVLAPLAPARLVVCVPAAGYAPGLPVAGSSTQVVAVDLATGDAVDTLELPGSFLLQHGVGEDVAVGYVHADGALGVARWSPHEGRVAWTFRSAPGVLPEGVLGPWAARVTDGVLTLQGVGEVWVDLATGAAAASDDDVLLERHVLPDGSRAVWRYDARGVALDMRIVGPDGTTRGELPGVPWLADQDDGSAPEVLVVQEGESTGLVGVDARTGGHLWEVPGQFWGRSPFRLDGRAVAMGPTGIALVELAEGTVLWSRRAAVTSPVAVTDGRLALVPVTIRGAGHLVALELASGVEAWRVPAPADAVELRVVAGTVVVVGAQETAGLSVVRDR